MTPSENLSCTIPEACAGMRFDQAVAELFPEHSRGRLQQWIKDGQLQLDGRVVRPRERVYGGERVSGDVVPQVETEAAAQDIPLAVVYADADLIVIDKPAGLVVHPAAGNPDGTLVNALLHHYPELAQLPRAGIVHRLDKDTTGLLVVARSLRAHTSLVEQLQERSMGREYLAVAVGVIASGSTIELPIGRHPVDRKRMAVVRGGKPAITHYRVVERYRAHTLIRVQLETGRTHQIRVHLAHAHYPLLGDPVYGGRLRLPAAVTEPAATLLRGLRRQALHAARLELCHPASGEQMAWESALPEDLAALVEALQRDAEVT